jgi:hypothetical protein
MTPKGKAVRAGTGTAKGKAFDSPNYPAWIDPLQGWHNLAKPARMRQMKRNQGRGRR